MKVNVGKWGNSLGVRIPSQLATALQIEEGSELDLVKEDNTLVLRPRTKKPKHSLVDLLKQITVDNIHNPQDTQPVGREEW